MMTTWEDLDEKQENTESQSEEEIIANLCFMANIISDEETEVHDSEPNLTFENLQKAYDELLDDFKSLTSHYASLKKDFRKLSLEFEKLKIEKETIGHKKERLQNDNILLRKDVIALKIEVSETRSKSSSDVSELLENCKTSQSNIEKMVNGSKNLDLMLGGQKSYLDKTVLGFEKEDDEQSSKDSSYQTPACICCFKKGTHF